MDDWLVRAAAALGEEPLAPREQGMLLRLAREVAHGVERKLAPLSTYLAGAAAGRRVAAGISREEALREAVEALAALVPPESQAPPTPPGPA